MKKGIQLEDQQLPSKTKENVLFIYSKKITFSKRILQEEAQQLQQTTKHNQRRFFLTSTSLSLWTRETSSSISDCLSLTKLNLPSSMMAYRTKEAGLKLCAMQ